MPIHAFVYYVVLTGLPRDFFVRHSDDDAREARYLHRTWRNTDGSFYVGIDPPEGAKAEGIVRLSSPFATI